MTSLPHSDILKGLYCILDERWALKCSLVDVLAQIGRAGGKCVQYRNKTQSMREAYQQAVKLRDQAGRMGMVFIVNDRCDLAMAIEADGVHLGQSDLPVELARELLGNNRLIGISTHCQEEVKEASKAGANYLGFGPIYPTSTKNDHESLVGLEGLRLVRTLTELPIFAIGGITVDSVKDIAKCGADGVAVASAILESQDIPRTVQEFISAFESKENL